MSRFADKTGAEWRSTRRAVLVGACAALTTRTFDGLNGVASARTPKLGYAVPDWLIDPTWLIRHSGNHTTNVIALTTSHDYETAHIPGARLIDWSELVVTDTPNATIESWRQPVEALLTKQGLTSSDGIVIYDGGSFFSARLWWILDQLGHADKRILDGGLNAWIAAGQRVESGPRMVDSASVPYVGEPNGRDIANLDMVASWLGDSNVSLIDTRSAREYEQGHIPGAINLDHVTFATQPASTAAQAAEYLRSLVAGVPTSAERRWPSADELRFKYEQFGVTTDKHVVTYGATGVRAALAYFNLRLIGYQNVWVYLGSWPEWSSQLDLPVAIGRHP